MVEAYVLINAEVGLESQVLKELKKIEGVEAAHSLWGVYDIIAKIKADTFEKLKSVINLKIDRISNIASKLTLLIMASQQLPTTLK